MQSTFRTGPVIYTPCVRRTAGLSGRTRSPNMTISLALSRVSAQPCRKTIDMPEGYSGGAIWQPPAIDPERGLLYIGTGNNYEVPDKVKTCLASASASSQLACFDVNDFFDAALALDLNTGHVRWANRLQ